MLSFFIAGFDYRRADSQLRSRLFLEEQQLNSIKEKLQDNGMIILQTCNRSTFFSSKNISKEIITDYVQYGLKKNDQNKYVLKCDPRWESACFKLTSHEVWFDLKKINIPIKIILTPNSVVCNETSQNRIKKLNPQTEICFIDDTSHMLPLEKTEDVASEINNFLA